MAKLFSELGNNHIQFIQNQTMFFVGTAPNTDGHVNVSPKGYNTLVVTSPKQLIYADYHGSGNETANHLQENGRITFMWCSFDKAPIILRVYGNGLVIDKSQTLFSQYLDEKFPELDARIIRQLFLVDIQSVQTSCGYGVPLMSFIQERPTLNESSKRKYT